MPVSHERVLAIDVERHLVRGIVLSNRSRAIAGGYAQLGYPQSKGPAAIAGRIAAALDVKTTLPVVVTCVEDLPEGTTDFVVSHIRAGGFETIKVVPRDVSEQRANPTGGSPSALVDCEIAEGLLTSHAGLTLRDLAPVVGAGLGMLGLGAEPLLIWHADGDEPVDESGASFDSGDDTINPGALGGGRSPFDDDDDIIDAEIIDPPPARDAADAGIDGNADDGSAVDDIDDRAGDSVRGESAEPGASAIPAAEFDVVDPDDVTAPVSGLAAAAAGVAAATDPFAPDDAESTLETVAEQVSEPAESEPEPPPVQEPAVDEPIAEPAAAASADADQWVQDQWVQDQAGAEPVAEPVAAASVDADQWVVQEPAVVEPVAAASVDADQWVVQEPAVPAPAGAPAMAYAQNEPGAARDPFVTESEPGSRRGVLLLVGLLVAAAIALGAFVLLGGSNDSGSPVAEEPAAAPDEAEPEAESDVAEPEAVESDLAEPEATEPEAPADEPTAEPATEAAEEPTAAPAAQEPAAESAENADNSADETAPEPEPTVDPLEGLPPLSSLPERGAIFRPPVLYLEGPVRTQAQADELYQRAIEVVGPDNVVNEYVVRPDAPEATDGNVRVEQAVLFDSASAGIGEDFIPTLELGVAVMALNPQVTMVVEGHTDSVGEEEANQILSEVRAQAVVDYLVSRGVDRARLVAQGLGESSPVASNDTEEGRQINRRIEVNLIDLLSPAGDGA